MYTHRPWTIRQYAGQQSSIFIVRTCVRIYRHNVYILLLLQFKYIHIFLNLFRKDHPLITLYFLSLIHKK